MLLIKNGKYIMNNCFSRDQSKTFTSLSISPAIKVPKAAITAQPSPEHYPELALFKLHIGQKGGGQAKLYTGCKTQVFVYKTIFFGFSALFAFLGFLTVSLPSALGCGWLGSCFVLKSILMGWCFSLSAIAFTLGYKLSTEKEAVNYQVKKSLAYAAKIYAHKRARMGIPRLFIFFGVAQGQVSALKQMYQEIIEKIHDKKDETMHLISRISGSPIDSKKQEHLYNQAIEELRDKLNQLNHTFRKAL
jgi:hypothetical protein